MNKPMTATEVRMNLIDYNAKLTLAVEEIWTPVIGQWLDRANQIMREYWQDEITQQQRMTDDGCPL